MRKGVYPYEYIDDWKNFNEISLHEKEYCRHFEIKNVIEYHDLHVQSNTLLLADVFEKFRNTCLEIYKFDPAKFPGLALPASLKKT